MASTGRSGSGLGWPRHRVSEPENGPVGWPIPGQRAHASPEAVETVSRETKPDARESEPTPPFAYLASRPARAKAESLPTDERAVVSRETPVEAATAVADELAVSTAPEPSGVSRETSSSVDLQSPPVADTAASVSRETLDRRDTEGDDPVGRAVSRETPSAGTTATRETWPRPAEPRIITVANQKGGVGKTTSTVNLAAAMSLHGLRVLVIDLDPQGNASTAFGLDHREGIESVYDVLVDARPIAEVARAVDAFPNLRCVPATIDVAGAEVELVPVVARETRLRKALTAALDDYDYVFIDCPPSLGLLTVNALVAGHEVLIPIQCEFYALEGLTQLLRNIELVRSALNERLAVSTILLTMYDARTRLADQVARDVRDHFGELVIDVVIPRSVRISEAPGFGQTVITFDPSSRGARAYTEAARAIAQRGVDVDPAGTA